MTTYSINWMANNNKKRNSTQRWNNRAGWFHWHVHRYEYAAIAISDYLTHFRFIIYCTFLFYFQYFFFHWMRSFCVRYPCFNLFFVYMPLNHNGIISWKYSCFYASILFYWIQCVYKESNQTNKKHNAHKNTPFAFLLSLQNFQKFAYVHEKMRVVYYRSKLSWPAMFFAWMCKYTRCVQV